MSVRQPRRDRRYTINLEYCGHARRRHVARFCGAWLGQAASRTAALAVATAHAVLRNAILDGLAR